MLFYYLSKFLIDGATYTSDKSVDLKRQITGAMTLNKKKYKNKKLMCISF